MQIGDSGEILNSSGKQVIINGVAVTLTNLPSTPLINGVEVKAPLGVNLKVSLAGELVSMNAEFVYVNGFKVFVDSSGKLVDSEGSEVKVDSDGTIRNSTLAKPLVAYAKM